MIFNTPTNWEDLQEKVCTILNQVGFIAKTNKPCETPRGTVEIDVYAEDPHSIDNITYVTECKNWETKVSQTIVHAFTTVMHETGAHIGYIISKAGFQSGAYDYITNTNISVFTFTEFQNKYLNKWFVNHFSPAVFQEADSFIQYTEPINSRRSRYSDQLGSEEMKELKSLQEKYTPFSYILLSIGAKAKHNVPGILPIDPVKGFSDFDQMKEMLNTYSGKIFTSTCYSDLLEELKMLIAEITGEFNAIFGKDIFKNT